MPQHFVKFYAEQMTQTIHQIIIKLKNFIMASLVSLYHSWHHNSGMWDGNSRKQPANHVLGLMDALLGQPLQ